MGGFSGKGNDLNTLINSASGSLTTSFAESSVDAFSRLRVSNNHILLSSQQDMDDLPLVWDTSITGGGTATYITNKAATKMEVTNASGDKVIRQTKRYWLYRAGQSQQIAMTFADAYQEANIRKRMGYFDASDGIFLEVTDADIAIVQRSSVSGIVVEQRVSRDYWNLDRFDSTGPSKETLKLDKAQILIIDLQWLGVGRVRVGFDINGKIYYAHQFLNANNITTVYMSTGSLPVRYEIESVDASSGGILHQICSSVVREGGSEEEGILTAAHNGLGTANATATLRSVLSVRLADSHIHAFIKPKSLSIVNSGGQLIQWHLVLNPTLLSPLTWVDGYGQASEQSDTQVEFLEGSGHYIATGYITPSGREQAVFAFDSLLGVAADIDGNSDVLSVIAQSVQGTQSLEVSLSYVELF